MAARDVQALFLQVDASVELLRRNLAAGEQPLERFEQRANKMAANVDRSIDSMGKRFGPMAQLAENAASRMEKSFNDSFSRIEQMASRAIQAPAVGGGIVLGAAEMRQAADLARQRAVALTQIEQAAHRAAAGEGELTQEMRLYLQAAAAARIEADLHAKELDREAGAIERLEIELQQAGAAQRIFANGQNAVIATSRQQSMSTMMLGQQVQDFAVQVVSGQSVMLAFSQQIGQAAFAVQGMGGRVAAFAAFLASGWGAAVLVAITVLAPFVAKLWEGAEATKAVELASDGLSSAQSVLGEMFDLVTGKISKQNEMLRLNAQLQAINLRAEAAAARTTARDAAYDSGQRSWGAIFGGNVPLRLAFQSRNTVARSNLEGVMNGTRNPTEVAAWAERADFSGLDISRDEYLGALARAVEVGLKTKTAESIEQSLSSGVLAPELRRDPPDRRGPRGPSAETLARRAENDRVRDLNEDSSFAQAERQARGRLIDALRRTAESEAQRDQLLRDDINAEADAQRTKVANDLSAKKLEPAQAERLNALNEQTRQQRLQNVDIARASAVLRDRTDAQVEGLDHEIEMTQLEANMATTARQRQFLELRILDLQEQRESAIAEAVLADQQSSEAQKASARRRLDAMIAQRPMRQQEIENRTQGPLDSYVSQLRDAVGGTDELAESLERVKADGFRGLEDSLADVISGTKSVEDAFGDMANAIIADLVRIAVQRLILGTLTDGVMSIFGGGGGINGSVKSAVGALKRAEGGSVVGPGGPTSDSIPAWLSNGEFVLRAEAVRRIGVPTLNALNTGRLPGFAAGGLVTPRLPRGLASGGASRERLQVDVRARVEAGPMLDARIEDVSARTVAAAAEPITAAAETRARRGFMRPKLPGGVG